MTYKYRRKIIGVLIVAIALLGSVFAYANQKIIHIVGKEERIDFKDHILDTGRYELEFKVRGIESNHNNVIGDIFLEVSGKTHISYYKEFSRNMNSYINNSMNVKMPFDIFEDNTRVTPFAYVTKGSYYYIDEINIKKIPDLKEKSDYESNVLSQKVYEEERFDSNIGLIQDDPDAQNGKVLSVESNALQGKFLSFGPYSLAEKPGKNTAIFRIKTNNNTTDKAIVKVEVFNAGGNGVNKYLILKGTDFKNEDAFQDFKIDYIRTKKGSLEFRVLYLGNAKISLDNVTNIGAYGEKKFDK